MRITEVNLLDVQGLLLDEDIAVSLGETAAIIATNVDVPVLNAGALDVFSRYGVGPEGADAQVIMSGPGAIEIEFGTSKRAPLAPLRKAVGIPL